MAEQVTIGIIGGSGVQEIFDEVIERRNVHTPYGSPSGFIEIGKVAGVKVAFMPRHGKGHTIPPHKLNYRANIHAMWEVGVRQLIAVSAVGSLKEDYRPGEIAIPDQFIDFTKKRDLTFYEGGKVVHTSLADPFCKNLTGLFHRELAALGIAHKDTGTYVCIEGPRFSTRAESRMYRQFADIIGMTLVPECQLAREKEICYATMAMVTDYDVWADHPVNAQEVVKVMGKNVSNVKKALSAIIPKVPQKRDCECARALEFAMV